MDRQKQVCRPYAVLEPIQIRSGRGDRLAFEETRRFNLEAWRRRFPDPWNGHSRGTETEGETEDRAATNWSAGMDGNVCNRNDHQSHSLVSSTAYMGGTTERRKASPHSTCIALFGNPITV